ncbi:MAG: tetratricopeptide repeat protein [Elusimicrobia bacterium]|nr:tetratricopeptide repeat protein [Elusimicrobiota bacterium]MBK7208489.1 tetratricopeptide repeat protein [Elusimicrobiota bacterium]MBK7545249.1 tetratricopeptide repeat protein [Elusimicrobiota bacterium]MBK7575737.1 tetratricopeptide repeat protein [Elusimicrobiota bacterium]MBK8126915.1 tetratricopeptide repeat protein [Elusimicrobiota bacterium]
MKRCLFALLCATAPVLGAAEAAEDLRRADAAYAVGDFEAARAGYASLIDAGRGGADLRYNLGNALYRLGQIGPARLWYERALLLSPRHEDARHNRDLIRRQIGESAPPGDFVLTLVNVLWTGTAVFGLGFFGLLLAGLFRSGELVWWGRWVTGVLYAIALAASLAADRQAAQPVGVVVAQRVEARAGPSAQEQVGFLLPEGQKVALFETINGWTQVGLADKSLKGWVPVQTVSSIRQRPHRHKPGPIE